MTIDATPPMRDGRHDFDFLAGRWAVSHRRLIQSLAGSNDWQTFTGTCHAWPLLGGLGNVDDNLLHLPAGDYRAASLRAFDPGTQRWSIWWLDGRAPGRLDPPVVGAFESGIGTFLADDTYEGRPIRVRFTWSGTDTPAPRWEQAFSADAGKTWETNWAMNFSRLP
jgi:hypothetical protein